MHSISKSSPAEAMMLSALSPTLWITILLGFSEKQIEKMLIRFFQADEIPKNDTGHVFFHTLGQIVSQELQIMLCFLSLLSQIIQNNITG